VIAHQAPSEEADVAAEGLLAKNLKIPDSILIGEEDVLPIIASLSDMMCGAR
jgi:hypothetical protein